MKYFDWIVLNRSIWSIDGALTGANTPGQGEVVMKEYFTFEKSPELKIHHQM